MDIYREQLLDHYRHPQHWGLREGDYVQQRGFNPLCADDITVQLAVRAGVVTSMQFEGNSCVISRAAASLLAEKIRGARVADVSGWQLSDVEDLLGIAVPPARVQCALLALNTAQKAITGTPGKYSVE